MKGLESIPAPRKMGGVTSTSAALEHLNDCGVRDAQSDSAFLAK